MTETNAELINSCLDDLASDCVWLMCPCGVEWCELSHLASDPTCPECGVRRARARKIARPFIERDELRGHVVVADGPKGQHIRASSRRAPISLTTTILDAMALAVNSPPPVGVVVAGRGRASGRQERHGHKIRQQLAGSIPHDRRRELNKKYRQLTDAQALEIRVAYRAGGTSYNKLAAQFGVKYGTIALVIYGSIYKDAGGPFYWREVGWFDTLEQGRALLMAGHLSMMCAA